MKQKNRLLIVVMIGIFGIFVGIRKLAFLFINNNEIDKSITIILSSILTILLIPLIKIWIIEYKIEKSKRQNLRTNN